MKQRSGEPSPLRSADRLLTVLRSFTHSRTTLTASELAVQHGLAYSTVRRLLNLLEQHDMVHNDAAGGYVVGPELRRLAQVGEWQGLMQGVAQPIVDALWRQTGETVILSRREGCKVIRVMSQITRHALQVDMRLAGERPIYVGSATGKALLAWEPDDVLESLLPERWDPVTKFTPSARDAYIAELRRVRERGYAVNEQESELGVWAVAAPVFDVAGHVAVALTVPVPHSRLDDDRTAELVEVVQAGAADLSRQLRGAMHTPVADP